MKVIVDLFYAQSEMLMVKPSPVQLPSQWVLNFRTINQGYEKSYGFPAKPTRKQIKERHKLFLVSFDMFLHYK